jgi:hypothetical protein
MVAQWKKVCVIILKSRVQVLPLQNWHEKIKMAKKLSNLKFLKILSNLSVLVDGELIIPPWGDVSFSSI